MAESEHIVCPHCDTINRVPIARQGEAPQCGHCHQMLFAGQPLELSGNNFRRHIDGNDIPVVVDFWASWCGPCRSMAPQYAQAAAQLEPGIRLAKLDIDAAQNIAGELGIRSIPTMILFRSGREVARQTGAMAEADIVRWVRARNG